MAYGHVIFRRIIILLALGIFCSSPAMARTKSIATGSPSGIYYPFGGGLASVWSKSIEGFNMKAEVTGGSLINVIQVARGESDAALAQANVVLAAWRGEGKFPHALPVSVLFSLYPNLVHVITLSDSGIEELSDLKGKTVSLGAPGSGTAITASSILDVLGMEGEAVSRQYLNYTETTDALRDGRIDAGFIVGGVGVAAVVELALTRDIRLLPFSEPEMTAVMEKYPAYSAFQLPEGVYRGVEGVQIPAVWNVLVVHRDMDEDTAYRMTKAAYENRAALEGVTKAARYMTPDNAYRLPGVPLHPGATRYLSEITPAQKPEKQEGAGAGDGAGEARSPLPAAAPSSPPEGDKRVADDG